MTPQAVLNAATVSHDSEDVHHLVDRVTSGISHVLCAVHGHDEVLHFERGRVSLRCMTCGHESPGWTVGPKQYTDRMA